MGLLSPQIEGSSDELEGTTLADLEMNKAALRLPIHPRYDLLPALDPTLVEEYADRVRLPLRHRRPRTTIASASAGWPPAANTSSTRPRPSSGTSD